MNACRALRLNMSPKRFRVATTAWFSASEQTHCALVVGDWMNDCRFTERVLNIHRSGYNALLLLTWLVPRKNTGRDRQTDRQTDRQRWLDRQTEDRRRQRNRKWTAKTETEIKMLIFVLRLTALGIFDVLWSSFVSLFRNRIKLFKKYIYKNKVVEGGLVFVGSMCWRMTDQGTGVDYAE